MINFSFCLGLNTHTKRCVLLIIKFVDEEIHKSLNNMNNRLRNHLKDQSVISYDYEYEI